MIALALLGCEPEPPPTAPGHGPVAEGVFAPLGEIVPYATDTQRATFARGREVALHRFSRAEGLGPAFNVTFCAACHEKPAVGGAAGLYRNFFLGGRETADGAFFPGESAGNTSGVVRVYAYGEAWPARPPVPDTTTVVTQRNPIPFFGVGLLAELRDSEILKRADPDDADGDGISGKPNWDRGFVGRFGMKAQTVSIEGFIRGPLMNHAGITTDPLTDAQRAQLPVDSSGGSDPLLRAVGGLSGLLQAAAPDGPLADDDGVPDPELSTDDLFDLVSFAMLLAPPEPEPLGQLALRGRDVFDSLSCGACHTPRLQGPRGPLPVYSDLLVHDLGPDLADGTPMKEATGAEFRSAPLWGVIATAPYLHDGRAGTLDEAIRWHGGEALRARRGYEAASDDDRAALLEFLASLGGRDQVTAGLLPPGAPIPAAGDWGGPLPGLDAGQRAAFERGRAVFDRDHDGVGGVGGPRFNGDSCRACHFEPVLGGAGPRDVNVMRHGLLAPDGGFVPPAVGTVLHKQTTLPGVAVRAQPEAAIFEHRQTPHLFGLGLLEGVPEEALRAAADPDDLDGDGISGKVSIVDGDRVGRFGWKAQVPSLQEFVRDAATTELGMTLPWDEAHTYGDLFDADACPDPELEVPDVVNLAYFLSHLGPPPAAPAPAGGAERFADLGCAACHTPELPGADGPVRAFTDLLLHEVLPADQRGIEEFSAGERELRTPPLWGVGVTGPWWHTGEADTLVDAIGLHDGEAAASRAAFDAASPADQALLLRFLESL